MPSNAVSVALANESRTAAGSGKAGSQPAAPRRVGRGRSLRPARSYLLVFGLVMLALWLVLVFGRALTELNEATERAAAVGAESAALQARLEAGQRELELVQTDAFQAHQARAYGLGREGERAFALETGAPPAPVVTPLGAEAPSPARTPLQSWLVLLFGP
ncbi:hypothetical protein BH24CHL6_BH24CHL6_01420 [soil metagenome]